MSRCKECKLEFTNNSNLRAHVKRKHPDKLDVIAPISRKPRGSGNLLCIECKSWFVSKNSLRLHVGQKHPDKMEELAPAKPKKDYKCEECGEEFRNLKYFVRHKSTHKPGKMMNCPLCAYKNVSKEQLIEHYSQEHSFQFEKETMEFQTFDDFQAWKLNMEAETYCLFVKIRGTRKILDHTFSTYYCHRSGHYVAKGTNSRKLKSQGSKKMGGYCPAKINLTIKQDKCYIEFYKNHIGHDMEKDLGHIPLTKSQRDLIAGKIAAKIPLQTILDEYNSKCQRKLTKKDLYNIQQSYNLKRSDSIGADSVDSIGDVSVDSIGAVSVDTMKEQIIGKLQNVINYLKHVTSKSEIEAVANLIDPLQQAIKNQQQVSIESSKLSHKGNKTPPRHLFTSKRKRKAWAN